MAEALRLLWNASDGSPHRHVVATEPGLWLRPVRRSCHEVLRQPAPPTCSGLASSGPPLRYITPSATSASSQGAASRRTLGSAISSVFQITAAAFSTFLYRFVAAVRKRTAAKDESTGFAVRRCFFQEFVQGTQPVPVLRRGSSRENELFDARWGMCEPCRR
jgi:hypothetical protein